jgi:AcrR family transcriptional regulator
MIRPIEDRDTAAIGASALTRAKLIATAEQLFAERGIHAVSLAEINLAAGQRNKTAAHYHFGDKDGLLRAVLDKHLPGLMHERDMRFAALVANGDWSARSVIRALLEPLAAKLADPDGGCEFLRISAQLASSYTQALEGSHVDLFPAGLFEPVREARNTFLAHLPPAIAKQRVSLAISMLLHGLAEHSRTRRRRADTELFVRNLEDCLVAMCEALPSKPTHRSP